MVSQLSLSPVYAHQFPSTRYQGSKAKLVDCIWEQLKQHGFPLLAECLIAYSSATLIARWMDVSMEDLTEEVDN